ncbi:MAG: tRNA-(ms[2]io[6]A)-hydroxylase [Flavobacteriaceae bacterium]|nr:tRNA-(ms[2]io[6]A)-hydroxylase [Flavobacteriaceae bacterium]
MNSKTTLGLELPTDPRWAELASMQLEDILTDHAYCEQKAASSMISIITLHPERELIVEKLAPVVTEEWGHFRMVLKELKKRNLKLGRQRPDLYVKELQKGKLKGANREDLLLDQLLMCALIEARSCERFKILSEILKDHELSDFYHQFMVAEAGHYKLFLQLANHYFNHEKVSQRWKSWLTFEAEIMKNMELRADRMH